MDDGVEDVTADTTKEQSNRIARTIPTQAMVIAFLVAIAGYATARYL